MKPIWMVAGGGALVLVVAAVGAHVVLHGGQGAVAASKAGIACPSCGMALSVADCSTHKTVDCPNCGEVEVPPECCPPEAAGGDQPVPADAASRGAPGA